MPSHSAPFPRVLTPQPSVLTPSAAPQGALKLDCLTLAKIFSGKTTRWDDPEIIALNPDLVGRLPSTQIIVLRRSVGCGSTYGMTNYFSR